MKISSFIFFSLFLILSTNSLKAQVQFSGWVASFNTLKVNNKLSLHFDVQLRSMDKLQQVSTILLRPGLNFQVHKNWVITGGYAFISNYRTVNNISDFLPEQRIWQQAVFNHKLKSLSIGHRLRFEERFISKATTRNNELKTAGYDPAFRFRYFVRSIIPFSNQSSFSKGLFFALQNEIFLNTGNKEAVNQKTFDQNRLYSAIGYRLTGKTDVEAGYMNQYISTRSSFTNNHIVQLALYKRL